MRSRRHPADRRTALRPLVLVAAILAALAPLLWAPSPAQANVENFSYDRWDVEYDLSLDENGRAVAHVTETLVARFPETDQNRGIVRSLPRDYEGASTDPREFRVTDERGEPVPFETESGTDDEHDAAYVAVLTGDDEFVHGRQTYVIEYTLSDVILARDDGAADEFYWDIVPSARQQPIASFTALIRFDPELAEHLTGQQRCYSGGAGSSEECPISGMAGEFRIGGAMPLNSGEGVTVAIGLDPGTAAQPPQRLPNPLLDVVPFFVAGAGLVTAVVSGGGVVALHRRRRNAGRGTVVAQYDVPAYLPPLVAAPIAGAGRSVVPAQLVHLAVNGVIRFEDAPAEGGFFGASKPQLALRVLDPLRADDALDKLALSTTLPSSEPGAAFVLPKKSEAFAKNMQSLQAAGANAAEERGYFEKARSPLGRLFGWISIGIVAVLAVFVVLGFALRSEPAAAVIGMVAGILILIMALIGMAKHRVYTPAGAETREYLQGVKMFIEVAESDRLQMLQSYEGAERLPDGSVNVIHLYEKLLPYAMLFGLEKQWGRVLESWYRANPDRGVYWYPGVQTHGIDAIGDTVSQMVSSISSSVSYSSSSSGGSGGGGSVGGGGGGGSAGGR